MTGTAVSTFTTIHGTPRAGAVDADAPAAAVAAPSIELPAPRNLAKFWKKLEVAFEVPTNVSAEPGTDIREGSSSRTPN